MEQLSLFGGSGPFSSIVKEMGTVKSSNSFWAGNIGAMVGDLTDILGSMKLSYELSDLHLLSGETTAPPDLELVKERFLVLQRDLSGRLGACFAEDVSDEVASAGGALLPLPAEMFKLLTRAGAFDDPPPAAKQLGGVGWAPYGYFFREWNSEISQVLEEFRGELTGVFHKLGSTGVRFEHLEAALHDSIKMRLTELIERVPQQLEVVFRQRFVKAKGELGGKVTLQDLERWWEPGEWLADFIGLLQRGLEASLQFQAERVQALVEAALSFDAR